MDAETFTIKTNTILNKPNFRIGAGNFKIKVYELPDGKKMNGQTAAMFLYNKTSPAEDKTIVVYKDYEIEFAGLQIHVVDVTSDALIVRIK